jgi:PAS domain S-box-containing protein
MPRTDPTQNRPSAQDEAFQASANLLQSQNQVLALVARGAPLKETLDHFLQSIEQQSPGMVSSILLLDDDDVHVRHAAAPSLPEAYVRAIDGLAIGPQAGSCGTAAFRREPVIVEDISTDPLWTNYRDLALAHGLRACWSTPIFDGQSRVVGTFALYFREVARPTQRHLQLIAFTTYTAAIAIVAHREREEAAHREATLEDAQRLAQLGSYEWDVQSNKVQRSKELCRIFGLAPDGFAPTVEAYLERVHPDDRATTQATVERSVHNRTPFDFEERIVRPDGSIRHLHSQGKWVVDESGRTRLVGICHDITDQRNAEARLRLSEELRLRNEEIKARLAEELRQTQKIDSLGRLAGGIAHDFNNLLTVIQGHTDHVLQELPQGDPLRASIDDVRTAAARASDLTRQLLAFSRRQVLHPRVVDLNALLVESTKMLRRLLGEDIELHTAFAKDLGNVKADPGQLDQVILNLAINGRDAMAGGGKLTIETRNVWIDDAAAERHPSFRAGAYVMLALSDTGCGIGADVLPRIFEPFFTTKAQGRGTGLGLSMVYGIVKQSGGWIWVYSEPGHGTTFQIYLPRVDEAATAPLHPPLVAPGQGTESVLVVEDEDAVRKLTCYALKRLGYVVLEAANGADALRVCEQRAEPIALLITDVIMPGMSGPQLVSRLSALHPEMKVLYTSGYTDSAVVHHGALHDTGAFLQKPFTPSELGRKVREVLDTVRPE